jgi:hypothetical protein
MSPKELPAPTAGGDLTTLLRARHSQATEKKAPAVTDPFAPDPVDPAAVTGTDEERLTVFEAAMQAAQDRAESSLKAARARFVVEAGTALRAIRDDDLYLLRNASFEEYVVQRWQMDRTRAYQLIDAAPTMTVLSKIFDTAPVESHARVLAPVLAEHGEQAVREVVAAARQEGKLTAAAMKDTAKRLNYIAVPAPEQAVPTQPASGEPQVADTPGAARAAIRMEQGMTALRAAHKALRGKVIPDMLAADPQRGAEMSAQVADLARKIERLATPKQP